MNGGVEVAAPGGVVQMGDALPGEAEAAAVLGFGGQSQFNPAAEGFHGDFAA